MRARHKLIEKQETTIVCTRYTMPIEYNREMCISRYGKSTTFLEKKMSLQVVVPSPEYISEVGMGTLYSFLPTQVKTNVPISCHIPFKLDSSRENIDYQEKNKWFVHSCDEFSKMLDYVFIDLSRKVKNDILYYVPPEKCYFFTVDTGNDKVQCLKTNTCLGAKFLQLPIFYTEENHFKKSSEIFSFSSSENIDEPDILSILLDYGKELYIPPEKSSLNVAGYGIEIVYDAYLLLFSKAVNNLNILKDAMDIIDTSDVQYSTLIKKSKSKIISFEALQELSKHAKCFKALNEYSIDLIRKNKALEIEVTDIPQTEDIRYIISRDEPIDSSYLDENVSHYLVNRKYAYARASLDKGQPYLIAKNVLILSDNDTLNAFAQFCCDIGKNDCFSANMTMRAASIRLNQADDSLTVSEYMKLLQEVRNSIKLAFGKKHYESYIKVIRELNSDPHRFIRELLQNADDCNYSNEKQPYFKLSIDGTTLTTEYNEDGFTKENVRSITAIGESTKKQLSSGAFEIGEKGIGFKTVFAVAEAVDIHSSDFHFRLTASTPTIPSIISPLEVPNIGTTMVFKLRKRMPAVFATEQVLTLCLCLRHLKNININGINVSIEDSDDKRIIQVDKQQYVFDVYKHSFVVSDSRLLNERNNGSKNISEHQEIIFYVSEKNIPKLKYYLYCGLPTAIEIGVPFAIDAPFELTASRDNILQNNWNINVRHEMYQAYSAVLEKIAQKLRIKVMQYIRFQSLQFGSTIKFSLFKNDEDSWLDNYNVIDLLKKRRIIPTYEKKYFAMPVETSIYRYPAVIHSILTGSALGKRSQYIIEDTNNAYDAVLKNLGCRMIGSNEIARVICEQAYIHIHNEKIRTALYTFLSETNEMRNHASVLKKAKIIPVKGRTAIEETQFVAYDDCDIYVDNTVSFSPEEYKILDTNLLSKNMMEKILGVDVVVMDSRYKKSLYDDKLEEIILAPTSNEEKYRKLMFELRHNPIQLRNSVGVLLQYKDKIPLRMENDEYRIGNAFITTLESGYFYGEVINSHIVSKESMELAQLIDCRDISFVSYEFLDIHDNITADDIEDLRMPEIRYGYQILEQCMFDGFISDKLIEKYKLSGIKKTDYSGVFDEGDFPKEPVKSLFNLRAQISSQIKNARRIIKEKEWRTVDKIELPSGKRQLVNSSEIRENTLRRYRPSTDTDGCFCQMCRAVKSTEYMEVRNIWAEPEYYWPQTRISLCLDCCKKFEQMRGNTEIMEQFYKNIETASIQSNEAISIPIGNADIRFTQTHLAEIQEILKSDKK